MNTRNITNESFTKHSICWTETEEESIGGEIILCTEWLSLHVLNFVGLKGVAIRRKILCGRGEH